MTWNTKPKVTHNNVVLDKYKNVIFIHLFLQFI